MSKNCVYDDVKIGTMTGKVKLGDGTFICTPHWKQMGFGTVKHLAENASALTSEDVHTILDGQLNGPTYLDEKSGRSKRETAIKQQFEAAGIIDLFGTKKEVAALPDLLDDNEEVKYATSGVTDGNTVLAVCTNKRVIFVDKGLVYGVKSTEIPLSAINAVSYSKRLLLGKIAITNGAVTTTLDNVNKETAQKMRDVINTARENVLTPQPTPTVLSEPDTADEIRKFKSLLDDGIISEEEFNAKKKELLGL